MRLFDTLVPNGVDIAHDDPFVLKVMVDRPPDETREQWLARTARSGDYSPPAIVGPAARPTNGTRSQLIRPT